MMIVYGGVINSLKNELVLGKGAACSRVDFCSTTTLRLQYASAPSSLQHSVILEVWRVSSASMEPSH